MSLPTRGKIARWHRVRGRRNRGETAEKNGLSKTTYKGGGKKEVEILFHPEKKERAEEPVVRKTRERILGAAKRGVTLSFPSRASSRGRAGSWYVRGKGGRTYV